MTTDWCLLKHYKIKVTKSETFIYGLAITTIIIVNYNSKSKNNEEVYLILFVGS